MNDRTNAMAIWNMAVTYPTTISVSVPSIYSKYLTLDGTSYSINSSTMCLSATNPFGWRTDLWYWHHFFCLNSGSSGYSFVVFRIRHSRILQAIISDPLLEPGEHLRRQV
jgi:hypothetical protein